MIDNLSLIDSANVGQFSNSADELSDLLDKGNFTEDQREILREIFLKISDIHHKRTLKAGHRSLSDFDCLDCKTPYLHCTPYMVHRDIWKLSGLGSRDGCLCIPCLEARIGRKLTIHDFTSAAINNPIRYGLQLGENHESDNCRK